MAVLRPMKYLWVPRNTKLNLEFLVMYRRLILLTITLTDFALGSENPSENGQTILSHVQTVYLFIGSKLGPVL